MLIEEQIKIARLIASGTPREVAINESEMVKQSPAIEAEYEVVKDTPQQKAKKRSEIAKAKQDALAKKRKEVMDRKKVERLRRGANKIRNTAASAITGAKYSKANIQQVSKDEGGATATQKAVGNVAKTGVAATKNVAKGLAKAVVGIRDLNRARKDRRAAKDLRDIETKQYELDNPNKKKIAKTRAKNIAKLRKEKLRNEEFIQEVEDKKDFKAKKVIDIMKGKNPIKINPDVKEDTVVVQDAFGKDFVEIVDIITPEKIRSDWRKEINVTEASAAWQRKEGKSKSGGLNEKGRKSYERQNPGSDLKAPSKKVGNKRRASFCARMKGMKKKLTSKKTARDPDSRINKSLRAWNC
jgi:hypothetical protein